MTMAPEASMLHTTTDDGIVAQVRDAVKVYGKGDTSVRALDGVDLDELAGDLEGYSAADCSALLREAALSAMRRDIDAAAVTVADVEEARKRVRPSLDPAQVADLKAYAERRLD